MTSKGAVIFGSGISTSFSGWLYSKSRAAFMPTSFSSRPSRCRMIGRSLWAWGAVARSEEPAAKRGVELHADPLSSGYAQRVDQIRSWHRATARVGHHRGRGSAIKADLLPPGQGDACKLGAAGKQPPRPTDLKDQVVPIVDEIDVAHAKPDDLLAAQTGIEEQSDETLLAHREGLSSKELSQPVEVAFSVSRKDLFEKSSFRDTGSNLIGCEVVLERDARPVNSRHLEKPVAGIPGHHVGEVRGAPERGQPESHSYAIPLDVHAVDELELEQRLIELGIDHPVERCVDGRLVRAGAGRRSGPCRHSHSLAPTRPPANFR